MMGECTLSKFAYNTKLGGAVNMLSVNIPLMRDLNRLEKQADRNFGECHKSKCKFLLLGWNDSLQPRQAGANCLGSSSAEKDLKVQVDKFI